MKKTIVLFLNLWLSTFAVAQCDIESYEIYYCGNQEFIDLTEFEPNLNGTYQYFASGNLISNPASYPTDGVSELNVEFTGDGIGCPAVLATFNIDINQGEIPALTLSPLNSITCNNASVVVQIISTIDPDVEYAWYANDQLISIGTEVELTSAGLYEVVATDIVSGCEATQSFEVISNQAIPEFILSEVQDLGCDAVLIPMSVIITGPVSQIEVSWYFEGVLIGQGSDIFIEEPGMYSVVVLDTNTGCAVQQDFEIYAIIDFPTVTIDTTNNCDGTTTIDAIYSSVDPTYTVEWFGPDILEEFGATSILVGSPGIYEVNVLDLTTGCVFVEFIEVLEIPCSAIFNIDLVENTSPLIYPMPIVDGRFNIDWIDQFGSNQNRAIKIYNSLGVLILEKEEGAASFTNWSIDLTIEPAGIFFLSIQQGDSQWVKQLVKVN